MSIKVLFQSWRIEGLMAHFYNIEPYLILFLDLDIVITCNLKNLWNYFDEFSDDEDRGFNTGVALMNIRKMRRNAWGDHWRNVTKHSLQRLSYTALADQDIVNAALFYDSRRVKRLPCKWNVQLADSVDYANCLRKNDFYTKFEDVFCENACILHWNKPIKPADATFPGHDAELQNVQKPTTPSTRVHPLLNQYSKLFKEHRLQSNILFLNSNYRLHRLEEMASHWDGPISLALYVTDKEVLLLTEYIQNIPILSNRQDLFIHLMFKEGNFYPINALRNIAMEYATTDYVFLVDFDFIPTPRMHTYLSDTLTSQISKVIMELKDKKQTGQNKGIKTSTPSKTKVTWEKDSRPVAYVIPAFETFYTQINFPINKSELLNQIKTGVVKPFRIDVWPAGHQATNYTHWYNSSVPYEVKWEADFEPYVVVKKTAARFDTRFLGFGWNKVAYAMLLDTLGYRFLVLPEVFVIHLPHSPSMDVSRFRNSPFFRMCLERFKVEFIKELAHNYGVRSLKYLQFRQRPNGL
ncbi:unnamed protein product [Dibothriocephalus latus]|uniref:Glycosyltransferase-like protein LARGE1 n=1 Tax=Dibothriocephalus latus TaxID=60516 RepID=A0A3P6TUM7_DIBLA|nr:unnamed protein product [Dibothriocephalus latus]